MIFRWIFPWFSHGLLGISLRSRCYPGHPPQSPLRGYSWPAAFREWPGVFEKFSHAQLLLFFLGGGRLAPAKKHLRRSFFGAKKKNKQLHQCTSMKSRITSEIPWLNVFSSACLEVYATLSTCAACSWPRNQMSGNISWIVVHIVPINVPGFRHLPPQKSSQAAAPGRRWAMAQSSERWPGIRKSHDIYPIPIDPPYRSSRTFSGSVTGVWWLGG